MSRSMNIVNESSPNASQMDICQPRPSLQTCMSSYSPVQLDSIEDLQTFLQVVSPVNHSASRANEPAPATNAICGPRHSQPYAKLDPHTATLRTFQACLLPAISSASFAILPKAGIACAGVVYRQPSWEQTIGEIDYGLWPTPQARDYRTGEAHRWDDPNRSRNLNDIVAKFPTPTARDRRSRGPSEAQRNTPSLNHMATGGIGGKLNPMWVEWLMNWPLGWTDCAPLETGKFLKWRQQHGDC